MVLPQIGDQIWKWESGINGPVVCILGGTHGNEMTGIATVKQLVEMIQSDQLQLASGIVYLILANPKAMERSTRGSDDHLDLNRRFTPTILTSEPDGTYEDRRAKELAPILASADISMDIHATNKPSVPMICGANTPRHMEVYQWFDCPYVLSDSNYVLGGGQVTTDEFVDASGGVGMCFESGQVTDMTRVEHVVSSLLNVLRAQKMIQDGVEPGPSYPDKQFYELERAILLTQEGFRFAENRGLRSFESFLEGDVIGYINDKPLLAPYDGMLLFPKILEHWKEGSCVCYLAIKTI